MTNQPTGTRLLAVLEQTAGVLDSLQQQWALVGGFAVSVRAEPRFTRDIDLAVTVSNDAGAEGLISSLVAAGFRIRLSLEHQALGRLAAVRLVPPGESDDGIVVDLLFASSGIEPEICGAADRLNVADGVTVPVAQAGHLIATKLLATAPDRPQDAIDLRALRTHLTDQDRELAREAVARIEERGANRSKPLREDFERWLDSGT